MNAKSFLTALVLASAVAVAATAATSSDSSIPATFQHHRMFHGEPFMAALKQLDLTEAQQQSIHGIVEGAHARAKAEFAARSRDYDALLNPGDPNYANAVRAAEAAATDRIEERSRNATQIYNLLSPEQQAKLPQVLADMKAKMQQRRANWQQQHGPTAGAPVTAS